MIKKISILCAVLLALLLLSWKMTQSIVERKIKSVIALQSAFQLEDPKVFFLGVRSPRLALFSGRLHLEDLACNLPVSPLLGLTVDVQCEGKLLNGTLMLNAAGISQPKLKGSLSNADLSAYPLAKLAGIQSGLISIVDFIATVDNLGALQESSFDVEISNVSKPKASTLNPPLVPISVKVPALVQLDARTHARIKNDTLSLQEITIASSLGGIDGAIVITNLSKNKMARLSGELQINLNEEGTRELGGWLSLLKGAGQIPNGATTLVLSGTLGAPRIQ